MNNFCLRNEPFFPKLSALTYSADPCVSTGGVGQVFSPEPCQDFGFLKVVVQ